jgi:hypothetical protein
MRGIDARKRVSGKRLKRWRLSHLTIEVVRVSDAPTGAFVSHEPICLSAVKAPVILGRRHGVPHEVTWHLTERRIEALVLPADAEPVRIERRR